MPTQEQIQKLADLKFLSQNTGVSTAELNEAYEAVGIDSSDNFAYMEAQELLKANGYNPGEQETFYGNNSAKDIGASLLYERWQEAPTQEELAAAGLENVTVLNSTIANSAWLTQEMQNQGIDLSQTSAGTGATIDDVAAQNTELNEMLGGVNSYWKDAIDATGSYDNATLDMTEWEELKKKIKTSTEVATADTSSSYTPYTAPAVAPVTEQPVNKPITSPYVSTPNIGVVTPTYGAGQTGISETPIPTYEEGLNKQATQFADRATCQATFYQPQTQAEKEVAGTAPAFENVLYRNRFGMSMYVQHINGIPSQPIPPGYFKVQQFTTQDQTQGAAAGAQGQNQGGMIQGFMGGGVISPINDDGKNKFRIFYPNGTYSSQFYSTEAQAQAKIDADNAAAGYNTSDTDQSDNETAGQGSSSTPPPPTPTPPAVVNQDFISGQQTRTEEDLAQQQRNLAAQAYVAPGGAVAAAPTSYIDPNVYGSVVESTAGQAQATAPMVQGDQVAQISAATTADTPQKIGASQVTPNYAFSDVQNATTGMTAAQSTGPTQTIDAAQQTGTSLSGLTSATGDSIDVSGAPTRTQQTGEMVQGTGVDQEQVGAAFGTGEVQAASIQGELANLMQQFEGGDTPAWAAGSMRAASQMLAARGLGASSMAGQAVIQAAMEAALPIAQIDTANKQQVALFKAEQRAKFLQMDFDQAFQVKVMNAAKVSEIANMNFTAEQQIALENSRAANTMALQNLSNSQALTMAEAAALAQMDTQNLNNRQQAAVQNAQNFLQVDMTNLANEQQTAMFKSQSLINSLLTDQAAANAALQFNASSENQTNQFFANLSSSIGQFNAAQMNAMKQFNAGEVNSLLEFNANIQNQREMFNAQNYLVVAQANAQWRQNLATLNTAAANESNMDYAKTVNGLTMSALDQIWQRERDVMDYAFTGGENQADRALSLLLGDMELESVRSQINAQEDSALGALLTKIFFKV